MNLLKIFKFTEKHTELYTALLGSLPPSHVKGRFASVAGVVLPNLKAGRTQEQDSSLGPDDCGIDRAWSEPRETPGHDQLYLRSIVKWKLVIHGFSNRGVCYCALGNVFGDPTSPQHPRAKIHVKLWSWALGRAHQVRPLTARKMKANHCLSLNASATQELSWLKFYRPSILIKLYSRGLRLR